MAGVVLLRFKASAAFCCYWQGHRFHFMNEHSKALLYLPLLPASTQKKLHTAKCDNLQQPSAHIHPSSTVGLGGLSNFVCRLWHLAGIKEQHNNVSTWEISSADIDCLCCFTDQSQLCITVPQFFSQVSFLCLTLVTSLLTDQNGSTLSFLQ